MHLYYSACSVLGNSLIDICGYKERYQTHFFMIINQIFFGGIMVINIKSDIFINYIVFKNLLKPIKEVTVNF